MTWLTGFDQVEATTAGGTYIDTPWRIVLHTTEGWTAEGAIGAYRGHGGWPHLTVDPKWRRRFQHYPLATSARALKNLDGGVETNRARAIQIEIVGTAATSQDFAAADLDWFGSEVIAPIIRECPVQLAGPKFVGVEAGTIATASAPQRMSAEVWLGFNGICGHQHVPENDHWDPGRIDIARILTAADPTGDDVTDEDILKIAAACAKAIRPTVAEEVAKAIDADETRGLLTALLKDKDDIAYARLKHIVQRTGDTEAIASKVLAGLKDGKVTTTQIEAAFRNVLGKLDED